MTKNKKSTVKISDQQIAAMQKLRSHGLTYNQIAEACGVGYGTAQKYTQDVVMLPKSMRQNPLARKQPQLDTNQFKKELSPEERKAQTNKEYWTEDHVPGTRLEIPNLDMISLTELQELMEEPTDYKSPLTMREWAQHYLEGPKNFLKYKPYKWGQGQLEIFDLWETHRKIMIECHRDYGKTMAVDAILAREICEHRENNYAICSETDKKARQRVKHIGDTLLKNKGNSLISVWCFSIKIVGRFLHFFYSFSKNF